VKVKVGKLGPDDIIADDDCPEGHIYYINPDYVKLEPQNRPIRYKPRKYFQIKIKTREKCDAK